MVWMREIMVLKMKGGIEEVDLGKRKKEELYGFMRKEGND